MTFCVILTLRVKHKSTCTAVPVNNWSCPKVNKNLRLNSFSMEVRVPIPSATTHNSPCTVVSSLEYCHLNMITLLSPRFWGHFSLPEEDPYIFPVTVTISLISLQSDSKSQSVVLNYHFATFIWPLKQWNMDAY